MYDTPSFMVGLKKYVSLPNTQRRLLKPKPRHPPYRSMKLAPWNGFGVAVHDSGLVVCVQDGSRMSSSNSYTASAERDCRPATMNRSLLVVPGIGPDTK